MTSSSHPKPIRAWQRMLSGRRLDLLNPDPADIEIEDIAHGLARVARWNGQTTGAHSFCVAQHALVVEAIADAHPVTALPAASGSQEWDDRWRMAALLHDAAEYVIGDLISPFKTAIGLDYKAFENRLMGAVHQRFGLPAVLPEEVAQRIKRADGIAAYYEATRLAGFSLEEAAEFFGLPYGLAPQLIQTLQALEPWPAQAAQQKFIARYQALCRNFNSVVPNEPLADELRT
jgi:uncharacterized protein